MHDRWADDARQADAAAMQELHAVVAALQRTVVQKDRMLAGLAAEMETTKSQLQAAAAMDAVALSRQLETLKQVRPFP